MTNLFRGGWSLKKIKWFVELSLFFYELENCSQQRKELQTLPAGQAYFSHSVRNGGGMRMEWGFHMAS